MQKCFTLTLLLIAAVVLSVAPASATAPIIEDLPTIIMGDGSGAMALDDAFDIDIVVDWTLGGSANGDYYPDNCRAFLYSSGTLATILGNGAEDLGSAGLDSLLGGALPANVATSNIRNQVGAQLVDLTTTEVGATTNDVIFVASVSDSTDWTTSSTDILEVETAPGSAGQGGWGIKIGVGAFEQFGDVPDVLAPDVELIPAGYGLPAYLSSDSGGPAFDAATSVPNGTGLAYGKWKLRSSAGIGEAYFIDHAAGGTVSEPVFEMKMTLRNEGAASYADCPGYRLTVSNGALTHTISILRLMTEVGEGANAPSTASNYTATLIWATPIDTVGMADGDDADDYVAPDGADGRDYGVDFEMVDWAGDTGVFSLETLRVVAVEASAYLPTGKTLSLGSGDFASWSDGEDPGLTDAGWNTGTASKATSLQITPGAKVEEFVGSIVVAAPFTGSTSVLAFSADNPNAIMRSTLEVSSSSDATAPTFRYYLANVYIGGSRNYAVYDIIGSLSAGVKRESQVNSRQNVGVPKAGGSTILCFASTGDIDVVAAAADGDYWGPQIAAFNGAQWGAGTTNPSYSDADGSLTFSTVTIDEVTR